VKVHDIRLCKCSYVLSIQKTNVRLYIFLYVFSIKQAMRSSLVIYKSITYTHTHTHTYTNYSPVYFCTYFK